MSINCIYINILYINVSDLTGLERHWSPGDEHEDRVDNFTVFAWFDLFDVRIQRVPSLYSHAAAYGRCSAVLRDPLRVGVLRRDFLFTDRSRSPPACESATCHWLSRFSVPSP